LVTLRPRVLEALRAHGIEPAADAAPAVLREQLNDLYLEEVRRLKQRQVGGEIPRREYAGHVEALRERFTLLGLPLDHWSE
jgi:hypothetical protein